MATRDQSEDNRELSSLEENKRKREEIEEGRNNASASGNVSARQPLDDQQDVVRTWEHDAPVQESSDRSGEVRDSADIDQEIESSAKDLNALQDKKRTGSEQTNEERSMNYSDTDEDENEGLGDGNLGRSSQDELSGK